MALAVLLLVITACSGDDLNEITGRDEPEEEHHSEHFSYSGDTGPEHWGAMSDEWETCDTGVKQSPIELTGAREANDEERLDIDFHYQESALRLVNNGHTVKAVYDSGSSLTIDGKVYTLQQFHMHAQSEHTFEGQGPTPIEIHFVHQADDNSLAVVGVLAVQGSENPAYSAVMDNLPAEVEEIEDSDVLAIGDSRINAADMLPDVQTIYHYPGSLTTPGCGEDVAWHVFAASIEMSESQILAFKDRYPNNARPVQPIGDRELLISSPQ